jgi:hypothetical protein
METVIEPKRIAAALVVLMKYLISSARATGAVIRVINVRAQRWEVLVLHRGTVASPRPWMARLATSHSYPGARQRQVKASFPSSSSFIASLVSTE